MIAIIPARGGSKGLPGKNIRMLDGKPLIAHTIEAAKKSNCIDRVIVTTDSEDIADVARMYGAEVPFLRPDYLGADTASAVDVYIHCAEYIMKEDNVKVDKFIVLLPTAPLRNEKDIDDAVALWKEKKATTLVSMTEAETPISWYYIMNEDGSVKNAGFDAEMAVNNRQDNHIFYIPNGAIYILDYRLLKEKRTYYAEDTIAYIMDRDKAIDIDTAFDFQIVEYIVEQKGRDKTC